MACLLALPLSFLCIAAIADEAAPHTPQLLLNAKLLRRLKRDRERQTVRWTAFENRVKNVPDSPERGFELALYFAVTNDGTSATQALTWAAAHPCERRQTALIHDWVGSTPSAACPVSPSLRDQAFQRIVAGADTRVIVEQAKSHFVPQMAAGGITSSADLYAMIELLSVLRANGDADIRNAAPQFFQNLPVEFLLSLRPDKVEKPDWMTHVAALALVSVDPNLEASQFLQGWAMEDRQTLHEGPGVAYEFLWADPYLPGIAYQNLDPWIYDVDGSRLFARSDWSLNACWISISTAGVKDLNCPAGWRDKTAQFGSLALIPISGKCLELAHQDSHQSVIVWKLEPGQTVSYRDKKEVDARADMTGLWRPGSNVDGKVCRR